MNPRRLYEVFRLEFSHNLRRPLFWFLILILGFLTLEMSNGHASIGSGNATVGGGKAWITSEYAISQLLAMMVTLVYGLFMAVAAGMSVIHDHDLKVGEVIHATPLTPAEYVWGKYLAVFASFMGVLGVHLLMMIVFNHVFPHGENVEVIGPFRLINYLRPVLLFVLPLLIFISGTSFALGALTRRPILVFLVPVAAVFFGALFLWEWSPVWLSPAINNLLMIADPGAIRWLKETWLNVDRGVEFYNHAPVGLDLTFFLNRALCVAGGLGAMAWTQARFAASVRGARGAKPARRAAAAPAADAGSLDAVQPAALAALEMRGGASGFLRGAFEIARVELMELRSHPGLYLFVPMILIQTLGGTVQVGAFDTVLLQTPGLLAAAAMNTLTLLVCMLLLFYTVESLQRERSTGLASIHYATPLRTASLLFGKALANSLVGVVVLIVTLLGDLIVLGVQGKVGFDPVPFALLWGLLLVPTFLLWTSFVSAVYAITGSRYVTYALGLGAMIASGFLQLRGKMNWVGNWDLWSAVRWSDMSRLELDRGALVLNRLMALGLTALFIVITVRLFARREADATRTVHRLRPGALLRASVIPLAVAVLPIAAGVALYLQVHEGREGAAAKKLNTDYWKKNAATWNEAPLPGVSAVDLDVDLDTEHSAFTMRGRYDLVNRTGKPLDRFPVTGGIYWKNVAWTWNGEPVKPDDRAKLYVFTPQHPLAPGERASLGFRYEGICPKGITRNGGGAMEFILPSAVVLTGFSASGFAPQLGYIDEIGVDDKNRAEPRDPPADYYAGITPPFIPLADQRFDCRMRVTGPAGLQYNATGNMVSDSVVAGRRITQWQTDQPVRIYNLVAGHWAEKHGDGVSIYYHAAHTYNVDEMLEALAGARRYYSEWFAPYPWRELRLSEFPALAGYAQGPSMNISFSEGIGFLTKSEPKANAAFWVTAHEAAHQWWGNLLTPARGPGNNFLSEGMAHFSTILLTEQVKGEEQRMAFCREIEKRYTHRRRADAERPLTRVDGSRMGDETVFYDKGGWSMWMLMQVMGRDAMLAGLKEFVHAWGDSADHPVVVEMLGTLRRHAPDPVAFDAFVKQWFDSVLVPEYRLRDATLAVAGDGWEVRAKVRNAGTGLMPVEVAAVRGERFPKQGEKGEAYHDARTMVELGPKQSREITIHCDFVPERLVVDPDCKVLQIERSHATTNVPKPPGVAAGDRAVVRAGAGRAIALVRSTLPQQ